MKRANGRVSRRRRVVRILVNLRRSEPENMKIYRTPALARKAMRTRALLEATFV
jgi:hypothetical protein